MESAFEAKADVPILWGCGLKPCELLRRERLFDREKIPPGQPLLQRTTQQKCWMERGHRADFAGARVIGEPAPARTRNAFLDAEQGLRRRAAEAHQNIGIGEFD